MGKGIARLKFRLVVGSFHFHTGASGQLLPIANGSDEVINLVLLARVDGLQLAGSGYSQFDLRGQLQTDADA